MPKWECMRSVPAGMRQTGYLLERTRPGFKTVASCQQQLTWRSKSKLQGTNISFVLFPLEGFFSSNAGKYLDSDEALKLRTVASLPRKSKTKTKSKWAILRGRHMAWDGRMLNVFFYQGASAPPRPRWAWWAGSLHTALACHVGNQGVSFCHTKVKCYWQPPSVSPGLKHPLFERRVFHLERGTCKSHEMGEK